VAITLTHVGGPTVLLEVDGLRILTDPTFDAPGRSYGFALGQRSTKTGPPALDPDAIGPLDAVLLTHDHHADNLDDAGRALLDRAPVVLTTVAGAERLGTGAVGLAPWASTTIGDLTVTATPCRHGPPLSQPIVGQVVGFALTGAPLPGGAVWFTGDTVLTRKVRAVTGRLDVDVLVAHVGAVRFPLTGPLKYTMDAEDAVQLAAAVRPRVAVPVHYEGWSHFSEDPTTALPHFAGDPWRILTPGEATRV
jgi:L-ascorbate metabolism protein UlaG (beta-lactamase superfamily)